MGELTSAKRLQKHFVGDKLALSRRATLPPHGYISPHSHSGKLTRGQSHMGKLKSGSLKRGSKAGVQLGRVWQAGAEVNHPAKPLTKYFD